MIRVLKGQGRPVLAAVAALGLLAAPALAATHKKPAHAAAKAAEAKADDAKAGAKPALSAKPQLVASFGAWGAYEAQGPKSKICYALAQPKERQPAAMKRDAGYIFISTRPGEHVKDEVSVILGTPLKENGEAKAEIGTTGFDLMTKGQNAWTKDAAQERQLVGAMKKHGRLVVKAPSAKGAVATDAYSLDGLGPALERVAKDCS